MPITLGKGAAKVKTMGGGWYHPSDPRHVPGLGFNTHADRALRAEDESVKIGGSRGDDWFTHHNRPEFEERSMTNEPTHGEGVDGVKQPGGGDGYERDHPQAFGWKSSPYSSGNVSARKAASARIAKIPLPLARHIARTYYPLNRD